MPHPHLRLEVFCSFGQALSSIHISSVAMETGDEIYSFIGLQEYGNVVSLDCVFLSL